MYRFSETNKWNDPWFRKLKAGEKLVFLYLVDNCDNAGFYEVDSEMMSFQIGIDSDKIIGAIKGLNRGIIGAKDWVWIKNFLKHQKNWPLNVENNAHKQIVNLLNSHIETFQDNDDFKKIIGAIKGLKCPIGKGKGKVEVKTPDFLEFISYAKSIEIYHTSFDFQIKTKYETWIDDGWKDGNNKEIKNWKLKLKNTMTHFKKDFSINNQPNQKKHKDLSYAANEGE